MKTDRFIARCLFAFVLFWTLLCETALAADLPAYHIMPGDALDISVWGEDSLQLKGLRVLPDGSISYPLAGRLDVAGLTSTDVEHRLTDRLKTYLKEPKVTVIVTGIDGNVVYVTGKVNKTGPVALTGPMTVLQVLSVAGGFDKFADTSNIKVLRNTAHGQAVYPVNYDALVKGHDLDSNLTMQAGDTILVP